MARIALVSTAGSTVAAVIMASTDFVPASGFAAVVSDTANIGDTYDGSAFQPPAAPAPTVQDLLAHLSDTQNLILGRVWSFDIGTSAAPLVLTSRLDADGERSMQSLALWAILNSQTSSAAQSYSNVDFSSATLTPGQALAVSTKAGAVISAAYATLCTGAAAITAVPPTITTLAQIDALAWPTN